MSFVYLASPHRHPNPQTMVDRAFRTEKYVHRKMREGHSIYSPIAAWHRMLQIHGDISVDILIPCDLGILSAASQFWILCLPGWEESKGIRQELEHAVKCLIPVRHVGEYQ